MTRSEQLIIVIGALPQSLLNFRGELIRALIAENCRVTAMASSSDGEVVQRIRDMGAAFLAYPVSRTGLNPFSDFDTWRYLRRAFRKLEPDIILAYTIKPVIWAALASRVRPNCRFYALITGLGFAFSGTSLKRRALRRLVTFLYRIALRRAHKVIFQNPDNRDTFIRLGIVPAKKCVTVNGSGVDIFRFDASPLPSGEITFLTIGRLLGEKGFREFASAAQIVKQSRPRVRFQLLGPSDPSPDGIPASEIQSWQDQGWLEYLGSTEDVRPYLQQCHVYVLPSYHEGLPRTVIEAMAVGRPILTTDVPGCRETVINGENGFLVQKANAEALAERINWFIENRDQWPEMAQRSRQLAEERFDVHKVNAGMIKHMGI